MDDRTRVMLATVVGASAGAVLGYLYLTEPGARLRQRMEPALDDLVGEIQRLRGTVEKARLAADEGWRSLADIMGEGDRDRTAWPGPRSASR